MKNLRDLLNEMAPFTEEELNDALSLFLPLSLKKKDHFLKAQHYSDRLAFVESGLLRSYFIANNKEVTTFFATPGSIIFDARSFIKQMPSLENIQVLEDCELLVIKRQDLENLYKENYKWQLVGRLITEEYFIESEERTIALQTMSAKDLYFQFVNDFPEIVLKVPLQYIASYLGVSSETLSRIRKSV